MPDTLGNVLGTSEGLTSVTTITPEQETQAKHVVCGSKFCRGPEDAATLLQALGLIPYREDKANA